MMVNRYSRWAVLGLVAVVAGVGCDDGLGPDQEPLEGTGRIFSLARPDAVGRPAAFDLTPPDPQAVEVESTTATQRWDIALSESDGALVLVPASAFEGQGDARIVVEPERSFAEVTEAPDDDDAYEDAAVPVEMGSVYIVRSRRLSSCVFFSKLQPIEVDAEAGIVRFEYVLNPNCNGRSFEPVEEG